MRIAIIGAGAMGCLYGGKLSVSKENEVYLLDIWKEHVDAVSQGGLIMEEFGEELHYERLKAVSDAALVGTVDLAIIFVKSTMTAQAVRNNQAVFGPKTLALTLQNGMGNIEQIAAEIGEENILAGTTVHGATMLGPGRMRHTGVGATVIGELSGEITDRLKEVASAFTAAGLETQISQNILGLVWDKLLINVGINPLTGITKLLNGQLLEHPDILALLEAAVTEGANVARAKGIKLTYEDPVQHCKDVALATAANKSSMLQDILNGKQTEIDMINGAILREGKNLGIETPVNMVLTNLIKFMQSN